MGRRMGREDGKEERHENDCERLLTRTSFHRLYVVLGHIVFDPVPVLVTLPLRPEVTM